MRETLHNIRRFLRGLSQVSEFPEQITVLSDKIAKLEEQNKHLRGIMSQHLEGSKTVKNELLNIQEDLRFLLSDRVVDVVELGPFLSFMYEDDLLYQGLSERKKKHNLQGRHEPKPPPAADLDEFIRGWTPTGSAMQRLLAHFLRHLPDFTVFDVGCQYGFGAMLTARFIESFSFSNTVYAFDPGLAGRLAPRNILNNGLGKRVRFYPYAVSNHDGLTLVFHHVGHSENNRIVNPGPTRFTTPVQAVSLDGFVDRQKIAGALFVKIDTQGAEEEVFQGMRRIMNERFVAGITEFVPSALRSRVAPIDFLSKLLRDHIIYEVSTSGTIGAPVSLSNAKEFIDTVEQSPDRWTDLAFIPKGLPAREELLDAFRGENRG